MERINKLVSVIIPTYRRPDTLGRAIESVLNQTYEDLEIIVVDDNGNGTKGREETEQFMERYISDPKIKYVKHEINKNGSAARNSGVRASFGEYIMFLDDDDEFLPCKVKAQVECMESRDESWGACYTKNIQLRGKKIVKRSVENREGCPLVDALGRNFFIAAGSNLMVRKVVFEKIGGFDESFLRNQDQEFLVKILQLYKIAFVDEVGLIIHLHPHIAQKMSFDELTELYIGRFEDTINSLDQQSKNKVLIFLNLQRFRMKVVQEKNLASAMRMVKSGEVNLFTVIRYFAHLFYRSVTRKSMGFNL